MIVGENQSEGPKPSRRIFTVIEEDGAEKENTAPGALTYLENKVFQARPVGRKQNYLPLQHPVQVPTNEATRRSNHVSMLISSKIVWPNVSHVVQP